MSFSRLCSSHILALIVHMTMIIQFYTQNLTILILCYEFVLLQVAKWINDIIIIT
jgi:hypothetical protein